ncbi:MAG: hypothetical protein U0U66_04730 [Cytophagaceae bacterium]
MTRKQKYIVFIISAIISLAYVLYMYNTDKDRFERLLLIGEKVPIVATTYSSWDVNYAKFYFITKQGRQIQEIRKCGNEFDKYIGATAIYNPNDLDEYELSFDIDSYHPKWRKFFYFFIALPGMLFTVNTFIKGGVTLYLKFKEN